MKDPCALTVSVCFKGWEKHIRLDGVTIHFGFLFFCFAVDAE